MRKMTMVVMLMMLCIFAYSGLVLAAEEEVRAIQFSDLSASHWGHDAIYAAVERGVVNGYPDGTFKPDQSVTRAEFIKMLVLSLDIPHSAEGSPWYQTYVAAAIETGLHDTNDFDSEWDKVMPRQEMVRIAVRAINQPYSGNHTDAEFMLEAVSKGIILGMGGGELAEDGLTTRAQALTVIDRILNVIAGHELPVDEQAVTRAEIIVESGFYHYALETGNIHDIDSIEVAKPFFEKFKHGITSTRMNQFGSAERFEEVMRGALDLVAQIEVITDLENEQFVITIPDADRVNYNLQLRTMYDTDVLGGTYVVPFSSKSEKNGAIYNIGIADLKVNSSQLFTQYGIYSNGQYIVVNGTKAREILNSN